LLAKTTSFCMCNNITNTYLSNNMPNIINSVKF
jgi:hypothetical protein